MRSVADGFDANKSNECQSVYGVIVQESACCTSSLCCFKTRFAQPVHCVHTPSVDDWHAVHGWPLCICIGGPMRFITAGYSLQAVQQARTDTIKTSLCLFTMLMRHSGVHITHEMQ